MTKVSIILPSYNHAVFLKNRLDSIVNQTYTDWEVIIIDDKSSDNSVEIITKFIKDNPDFKVKHFIVNETNSGSGYKSWQKGIALAETEFIWISETDDYSDPDFLKKTMAILESDKIIDLVFCGSNYVDEEENFLYNSSNRLKILGLKEGEWRVFEGSEIVDKLPFNTLITNGSSVVFRKPTVPIPDVIFNYRQSSDLFLWTFLLKNSYFCCLNENLNYFRRHNESTTRKISSSKALKGTYKEYIDYMVFFECSGKNEKLIEEYFNNYVWKYKSDAFDLSIFEGNNQLKRLYLKKLFFMTFKKIFNGK